MRARVPSFSAHRHYARSMRFNELRVENFRAIANIEISDLRDLVVIAGPNGCGKSTVFDAMRLLKSAYGGYQFNEWMQWFGEFQIAPNDPATFGALFRDRTRALSISANIQLAPGEIAYLQANAESVLEPLIWAEITGQPAENFGYSGFAFAGQFPHLAESAASLTASRANELRSELSATSHSLHLTIPPSGSLATTPSAVARAVFQTYNPSSIGILDFHGASRTYQAHPD